MYGTAASLLIGLIRNIHISATTTVAPKKPNVILVNNSLFSPISGVPSSMPKYINKLINMAANFAPGIPNITVVIIDVAFCALLAPSGPITPFMFPLPNFSFGLLATA